MSLKCRFASSWPLLVLMLCADAVAAITVRDDAGHRVELAQPARRVITLAPHLTEIVYAIGADSALLATVAFSDYPPAAKALPRVGGAGQISSEQVIAMQPDLVLAWQSGVAPRTLAKLRDFGIPVYLSEPRRLQAIAENIEAIGRLLGAESEAVALARAQRDRVEALRTRYAELAPVRVFYQVWTRPLLTINGQHVIGELLRLCGAGHLFADAPALTPRVSLESVVAAAPQLILFAAPPDARQNWHAFWDEVPAIGQVPRVALDPDLLSRPGPRLLAGAVTLCEAIDRRRAAP